MARAASSLGPLEREAMLGIRLLMSRGYEKPGAIRFTLNRLNYAGHRGEEGDDFIRKISGGKCIRSGDVIQIKEEGNA